MPSVEEECAKGYAKCVPQLAILYSIGQVSCVTLVGVAYVLTSSLTLVDS